MSRLDDWQEVRDPNTTPLRLAELAYAYPEFRPYISQHPHSYEGLRHWIATQGAPPASHAQHVEDPIQQLPKKRRLRVLASVGATIITAAAVAIPLIVNFGNTSSGENTLRALSANDVATPVIGELEAPFESTDVRITKDDWLIPTNAPIKSFPQNFENDGIGTGMYRCSSEQFAWLEEHAVPGFGVGPGFSIVLHNNANQGGALALGNVRFEGREVKSAPMIAFRCFQGGKGASGGGQLMLVDELGSPAVYGEFLGVDGDDAKPEGSEVSINLDPGEVATVTLSRAESVDRSRTYEGRFVADVMDGSGTTVVLAEGVVFRRETEKEYRLSFTGDYEPSKGLYEPGSLLCSATEDAETGLFESTCNPQEAAQFFRAIREARG